MRGAPHRRPPLHARATLEEETERCAGARERSGVERRAAALRHSAAEWRKGRVRKEMVSAVCSFKDGSEA